MAGEKIIKYEKAFVAFIDVLGFKKMVKSSDERIDTYFDIVSKKLEELKRRNQKADLEYIIISDSVIMKMPIINDKYYDVLSLRQLLYSIREIQYELAKNNVWIRGAVTSGNTYFDSKTHQVVGQAFIDAYELESSIAKYPRVIVDSKLVEEFKFDNSIEFIDKVNNITRSESSFMKNEYNSYENVIYDWHSDYYLHDDQLKRDVGFFVDYLVVPFKMLNVDLSNRNVHLDTSELLDILENIRNNLYDNAMLYEKFRWVADYVHSVYNRSHIYKSIDWLLQNDNGDFIKIQKLIEGM